MYPIDAGLLFVKYFVLRVQTRLMRTGLLNCSLKRVREEVEAILKTDEMFMYRNI